MAYKRHSQGGRFKAANFGDLGLRAFKDQQERQIRGLKEQAQEEKEIARGHLQEMRGAASREIQHNTELQNFYNKRDSLAIENTQFRGKTEYDRLMGEAREYEKKADFWKNFSQTYADQYLKAAYGIYDVATTAQSNHQLDKIYADPKFQKFEANNSVLNNISSEEQLKEAVAILRDPNATKDQINDYLGHIVDLGFRMNHKTKLALINRELANWDQEHINLRSLANNPGKDKDGNDKPPLAWNAETVKQFYYLRARELMRAYDIDPSSKAGRVLLEGIQEKQVDEINKLTGVAKANADTVRAEELWSNTSDFIGKVEIATEGVKHEKGKIKGKGGLTIMKGDSAIEYNNEINLMIAHEGGRYRMTENGVVVEPSGGNIHHDAASLFERLIKSGKFKSKEQAKRHTIMQAIPGATKEHLEDGNSMAYLTKDTWIGRHPSMADDFDKWWREYEKQQKAEFDADKINKDFNALQQIKEDALDGEIDLSDESVIKQLKAANAGNDETIKFLSNFERYNDSNLNTVLVTADLDQKFKSGDLKNLEEHLTYLPPNIQDQWRSKLEQLKILEKKGYIGAKLTSKAQGILKKILGNESLKQGSLSGDHFGTVTEYIKQDILATFDQISEENPDASDAEKISLMRQEIQRKIDNNEGVYRRGNSGLSTVFYIDPTIKEPGSEDVITQPELEKKLALDGGGTYGATSVQNILDGLTSDPKNPGTVEVTISEDTVVRKRLIPINEADKAIRNINLGLPLPKNETIDYLYNNQPLKGEDRQFSKRDFWNAYFESIGLGSIVKANEIDFSKYKVKKSTTKANIFRLSEEDQAKVGLYCELADEADFIDKSKPSLEATRMNEEKQVRNTVFDIIRPLLDFSAYGV